MLQNIRQNIHGTGAKIIIFIIVAAFALFGVESILLGGGGGGVAEVNGEQITPQELQQAVNNSKRRLIAMMGDNLDPAMLDDQRLSAQALEALIGRKLMIQTAEEMGLAVSERQIGTMIGTMEQFQLDGNFSPEVYRSVLSSAGYTPAYFKQSLEQDIVLGQLRTGLSGSEFATRAELNLNARISGEQRDLRYLTIPLSRYQTDVQVSDEQIASYYEANQEAFRSEEAVELEYIELRTEDFRQPVDEDVLLEAYELELQASQYQEENRVSHILFEQNADESDEAFAARIADAREQLAAGSAFADVARELSDDIGSAPFGGDLGFSSGDTFPAPMEEAIAALALNAVSEPVVTEAGTHLLLVTERRAGEPPSLEEMRPQLEERIALEEARVVLLRTAENLKDLAFNAEDLAGPAGELELDLQTSELVTRNQAEGLFANPSLLAAAFTDDVLNGGYNSDVVELSGDHYVVLRVKRHYPAEIRPLAAVRDAIVARISDETARAAVEREARRAVAVLREGASVEEVALESGFEWQVELGADRRNLSVPPELLQRAFSLPAVAEGESTIDYVLTPGGDARVFELARVTAGELDALPEPEQVVLQRQVSGEYGQLLDTEFQQGLRASADITVL
jgi:peptidyl-prolyl cis-trans isomerase D